MFQNLKTAFAAAALVVSFGTMASAATCPAVAYDGQTRTMTMTPDGPVVGCYAYGEGNIGNGPNDPIINGTNGGNTFVLAAASMISGLFELADTGDGPTSYLTGDTNAGNSGSVTVAGDFSLFNRLVLALKFGRNQQESPDWVAFEITGAGTFAWSQSISRGELSHTVLYAARGTTPPPPPPGAIPLPAAGWLMIAGLGGLAALRRRRKTA